MKKAITLLLIVILFFACNHGLPDGGDLVNTWRNTDDSQSYYLFQANHSGVYKYSKNAPYEEFTWHTRHNRNNYKTLILYFNNGNYKEYFYYFSPGKDYFYIRLHDGYEWQSFISRKSHFY